jgi:hypothetical protein
MSGNMLYRNQMIDEMMRGLVSTPMENQDQFMSGNMLYENQMIYEMMRGLVSCHVMENQDQFMSGNVLLEPQYRQDDAWTCVHTMENQDHFMSGNMLYENQMIDEMMRIINICLYSCVVRFLKLYTITYRFCGWWVGGPLVPSPCTSIVYTLTHMRRGKQAKIAKCTNLTLYFFSFLRFVM